MDRIHYAGDTVLTGSDIAHALLEYARALAQAGTAETVEIPTVNEQGEHVKAEILVGPASQLISHEEEVPFDEVIDGPLVAELRRRTENLQRFGTAETGANTVPEADPPTTDWTDFDDL